ncbi:hypothetical protein FOXG_00179 [Fusarium oxysporum f. sp. lycopersici 4287]|uniref:Uncharacterized protein n=8 Tax=Fusarium oxysporum TaxID=5507 RepID=A0A0J9WFT3_FUSO4|nr:hypothetical protein FOXG_00179 [Fusarium oxysporum f. sp. lycopersici 4287]EXK47435.1 hypothetical protein FOMG_00838 [Fusarium oxysporum f. sp. melonis 26406]KNA93831.1 hypothetical protein FOXG_00179 [Fusarium oxysporum f. sp. lycopersici 4287]
MANPSETAETFQKTLDLYIKPREQVNYIRRVLALHLGTCSHDGPVKQPVSLADPTRDVTLDSSSKGIYREYIEALKANVDARRNYEDVAQSNLPSSSLAKQLSSSNELLEEQVSLLKLQAKQARLTAVQNHLDSLMQKPAAAPEYLDPEDVFHDATSLPSVPKEVVNSLVAQQSVKKTDLTEQVAQLEKTVLRAKLLLRREEQLLRETRANAQSIPDVISNGIRLHALNTTRNELINWIETELSKASGDEDGDEDGSKSHSQSTADQATINNHLNIIKEKYANYLATRRSLLASAGERFESSPVPVLAPSSTKQQIEEPEPASSTYLLTPYIETLLALSKKQRAMITQKAHVNTTLGKEIKDNCQSLSHLEEESQLLPSHSVAPTSRRRSGLGEFLASDERSGLTGKVQPWVLAADSAKITTLENVAEQIEGGQLALENSMQTLQEIDQLLGQDEAAEEEETQADTTEDDVWLEAGAKSPSKARRHTEKRITEPRDAWSSLQGNLGLIGQGDTAQD